MYMSQKKDDYYNNIDDMVNADYKTIMLTIQTKYDILKSYKKRPFGSQSDEEQCIIALQTEFNEVKDSNLQLTRQLKAQLKPSMAGNTNKPNTSPQIPKTKNTKNNSDRRHQKQDEAWKKMVPKPGKHKTMKRDNKTWNWYIYHLAWCIHTSIDCRKGRNMAK